MVGLVLVWFGFVEVFFLFEGRERPVHAPTPTHYARTHTPQNATHARTYQRRRRRVHRRYSAIPTTIATTPAPLLLLLAGREPLLELPHPHPQPQRASPRLGRLGRRLPSVRCAVGFVGCWFGAGLFGGGAVGVGKTNTSARQSIDPTQPPSPNPPTPNTPTHPPTLAAAFSALALRAASILARLAGSIPSRLSSSLLPGPPRCCCCPSAARASLAG